MATPAEVSNGTAVPAKASNGTAVHAEASNGMAAPAGSFNGRGRARQSVEAWPRPPEESNGAAAHVGTPPGARPTQGTMPTWRGRRIRTVRCPLSIISTSRFIFFSRWCAIFVFAGLDGSAGGSSTSDDQERQRLRPFRCPVGWWGSTRGVERRPIPPRCRRD